MFPRHINNYLAHGESHNTNESVLTRQTPSIQNDGWELERQTMKAILLHRTFMTHLSWIQFENSFAPNTYT